MIATPEGEPQVEKKWGREIKKLKTSSNCSIDGVYKVSFNGDEVDGLVSDSSSRSLSLGVGRALTPRQRNLATASRSPLPIDRDHEPVEESYVKFFNSNVFGLVRSSLSSPSHAAVAHWLTEVLPPDGTTGSGTGWLARPLLDPLKYLAIRSAREVSMVEFAAKPENIRGRSGLVRDLLGGAVNMHDGMVATVTLRARRGRPGESGREQLKDVADNLLDHFEDGIDLEKAKVAIKQLGQAQREVVDLLAHRIAVSSSIPRSSDLSLDEAVVFSTIDSAYRQVREQIASAVEA